MSADSAGEAGREAGQDRAELGAVSSAIAEFTPYFETITAHLRSVVASNARAVVETIDLLERIDTLVVEIRAAVPPVVSAVNDLQAVLVEQLLPGPQAATEPGAAAGPGGAQERGVAGGRDAALADAVQTVMMCTNELAARIEANAQQLVVSSAGAAAQMQFEDIGRQVIGHVTGALDDLRQQLGALGENLRGEPDLAAVLECVRSVEQLHRMHVKGLEQLEHSLGRDEPAVPTETASPVELFELF